MSAVHDLQDALGGRLGARARLQAAKKRVVRRSDHNTLKFLDVVNVTQSQMGLLQKSTQQIATISELMKAGVRLRKSDKDAAARGGRKAGEEL